MNLVKVYTDTDIKTFATIETDYYNGNIFIKYENVHYIIILNIECKSGIDIIKINDPANFKNNLINSPFVKTETKLGKILPPQHSLCGKIRESLEKTDIDTEYKCIEETYFSTDNNDGEYDYPYYFNGIDEKGIIFSELLAFSENSFNTIFIRDNAPDNIISFVERADKFPINTLIINTNGTFKVSNIEKNTISKLSYISDKLMCI